MTSGRHESDEIQQEAEQNNSIISAPAITINPAHSGAALNLRLRLDAEKAKNEAAALGVALTYPFGVEESAALAKVSKNINSLFQPPLLAVKVYYAAPLAEIENDIRNAFKKNPKTDILLRTFHVGATSGTLSQLAVIGLDQTIRNDRDEVVDEGMAERALALHYELSPDTYEQALEKTRLAVLFEDEEAQNTRESANFEAVNAVFDSIQRNDADTKKNIADFKD